MARDALFGARVMGVPDRHFGDVPRNMALRRHNGQCVRAK